jgi:hypothetical protein
MPVDQAHASHLQPLHGLSFMSNPIQFSARHPIRVGVIFSERLRESGVTVLCQPDLSPPCREPVRTVVWNGSGGNSLLMVTNSVNRACGLDSP